MAESIACPHCGKKIQLTAALTSEIEKKLQEVFDARAEAAGREYEAKRKSDLQKAEENLAKERSALEKQAKKRAQDENAVELKDLKSQVEEKSDLLAKAHKQELDLRKKQRDLEDRERALQLETERTLDSERAKIREEAAKKSAEEHHLKDLDKDKQLADMRRQIEDLNRKSEQGSQQAQGEVLEVELEAILRATFRFDDFDPVGKGVKGGDVLHTIRTELGHPCGTVLWEAKRTKNWSDGWITKLKEDQRAAKADLGVIITTTLPKGIRGIGQIEGVWVADFASIIPLATAIRAIVSQVAQARAALSGKNEKMELLYSYLSGPGFKQRIEAIVESFERMRKDLNGEKIAFQRIWAKRETELTGVIHTTSGLWGDLQGLIGTSLPHIKNLELPHEEAGDGVASDKR
jgi:hypothetical protein